MHINTTASLPELLCPHIITADMQINLECHATVEQLHVKKKVSLCNNMTNDQMREET